MSLVTMDIDQSQGIKMLWCFGGSKIYINIYYKDVILHWENFTDIIESVWFLLTDYNDAGSWHSIAKGTTEKGLEAHPSLHGSDQNSATKFESSMSVLLLIFIIINADWPVFYWAKTGKD